MAVSFFDVDGATVTLLITDIPGDYIRLQAFSVRNEKYYLNYDSNNDGSLDSVLASFTQPDTGGNFSSYGIFSVSDDGSGTFIAAVDNATSVEPPVRRTGYDIDVPYVYLGSAYPDFVGANGIDTVYGNDGNDYLTAGSSLDGAELIGGSGNDRLFGYRGSDRLEGGSGRDTLTGGAGADVFVFDPATLDSRDRVTDFSRRANDRVDLSAFAPGLRLVDAFTGDGPEVRFRQLDDRTALIFDLNGDGAEDGRIAFDGVIDFTRADLIMPG